MFCGLIIFRQKFWSCQHQEAMSTCFNFVLFSPYPLVVDCSLFTRVVYLVYIMVNVHRWKLHEVIMYLLKAFIGPLKEGKCSFDVSMFMQTVVLPGMASNGMSYCVPSLWFLWLPCRSCDASGQVVMGCWTTCKPSTAGGVATVSSHTHFLV